MGHVNENRLKKQLGDIARSETHLVDYKILVDRHRTERNFHTSCRASKGILVWGRIEKNNEYVTLSANA